MFFLTTLTNTCRDPALARTISFLHHVFTIVCIVVPILLIVFVTLDVIQLIGNPENKKKQGNIPKKIIAAILIFLVPSFLNIVINFIRESDIENKTALIFDIARCWEEADDKVDEIGEATYNNGSGTGKGNSLASFFGDLSGLKQYVKSRGGTGETLEGGMPIPIYYQGDYADVSLGSGRNIATSGCGFTSGSMIVSYLLDQKITPRELISSWSRAYYVPGSGMSWSFPSALAKHYNLGTVKSTNSITEVVNALKKNQPVMSSQSAGLFTRGGHIIVLRGIDGNGNILVNDPNKNNAVGKGYNNRAFTPAEIDASAANYWIFEAKGS